MSRNEVKQNSYALFVCLVKETFEVCVRSVSRRDGIKIRNIVAGVAEGRLKTGVDPYCVTTQILYVIKLFDYAGYIADAVRIRVPKGLRINLIKNRRIKPMHFSLRFVFYFIMSYMSPKVNLCGVVFSF